MKKEIELVNRKHLHKHIDSFFLLWYYIKYNQYIINIKSE